MSFGLQIWDASGVLVFDSTAAAGGVPIGIGAGNGSSIQALSFPQYAGFTMQAICITGPVTLQTGTGVSISHALGYPVVTIQADAPTFLLAIF